MWTFKPDDVYEMSGYELDIPAFHTNRGYRVINMVVNGTSIQMPLLKAELVRCQ